MLKLTAFYQTSERQNIKTTIFHKIVQIFRMLQRNVEKILNPRERERAERERQGQREREREWGRETVRILKQSNCREI